MSLSKYRCLVPSEEIQQAFDAAQSGIGVLRIHGDRCATGPMSRRVIHEHMLILDKRKLRMITRFDTGEMPYGWELLECKRTDRKGCIYILQEFSQERDGDTYLGCRASRPQLLERISDLLLKRAHPSVVAGQ